MTELQVKKSCVNLFIEGSVTNTGDYEAFNAGLHVVAYDAYSNDTVDINMTVPLIDSGVYGTDPATTNYATAAIGISSSQLGSLASKGTATVDIAIYHEGTVTKWTVTPVWTNTP
jgi:hypothetical protein